MKEEASMREVICVSVVGGWQSAYKDTMETFGPEFHALGELWCWQNAHLFD